ncbi:MAG TPA: hypothetical protein VMU50_18585, partial [Polyangia bacterium]|nr:hypothetical protein [Polyangia bacterium]
MAAIAGAVVAAERPASAAAAAAPALTVLYHADLDGRFAVPACGKPRPAKPDYATLVGAVAGERARAAAAGAPAP